MVQLNSLTSLARLSRNRQIRRRRSPNPLAGTTYVDPSGQKWVRVKPSPGDERPPKAWKRVGGGGSMTDDQMRHFVSKIEPGWSR